MEIQPVIKQVTLNWTDLKNTSDLAYDGREQAGMYIWGFTINSIFIPYYLRMSNDIIVHIQQQVTRIMSGGIAVFHRDSLAEFKKYKYEDVQADMERGKLHHPTWPYGFKNFLEKRKKLQPHIDFMVEAFSFSYAVVGKEISMNDLPVIQRVCINQIGVENLINKKAHDSDKFVVQHTGNPVIVNLFSSLNQNQVQLNP